MDSQIRSVFVSDTHLGSPFARTTELLEFIKWVYEQNPKYLYLVGDIVDFWQLKRSWYWDNNCNAIIQKILKISRKGTQVIYLSGNHDDIWRSFPNLHFGNIYITDECVHETADGRKILVIHGDFFDSLTKNKKWMYHIGDKAYVFLLHINKWVNFIRRKIGLKYWSLSAEVKKQVKGALNYINNFEQVLARYAKEKGCSGNISGHIHHACIKKIGTTDYYNTGDFVESCSAIIEKHDGELELIHWGR